MKRFGLVLVIIMLMLWSLPVHTKVNYKQRMTDLIHDMSSYAKCKSDGFCVITNGGFGLYNPDTSKTRRAKFLDSVDGVLIEEVFYGYNCKMNRPTPKSERRKMHKSLKTAKKAGKVTMNIEYCNGKRAKKNSYKGSIYYNSPTIDLDRIPKLKRINRADITNIGDIRNFCAVLDPTPWEKKGNKKKYLKALRKSNYDLIFIDLFFNGKALTRDEVNSLKVKPDGTRRLVCSYISVGEAENYRYYWKPKWNRKPPSWIKKENPNWSGNYKVKYWKKPWRRILFGYLDRIIAVGFDGAYFDVIDAYEYFES